MNPRSLVALVLLLTACGKEKPVEEYLDRSKFAEAKLNLNALAKSMQIYLEMEQVQPDGTFAVGKVPTTAAAPTPSLGTCCAAPDEKCAPDPKLWAVEPWTTLKFEITTPHVFSYEYIPGADGHSFTFKAHADFDCDGQTLELSIAGGYEDPLDQTVVHPIVEPDMPD